MNMNTKKFLSALSVLILASLACSFSDAGTPTSAPVDGLAPTSESAPTPTVAASPTPQQTDCFNAYYPVKLGATWTYQMSGTSADTFTHSIVSASEKEFSEQDAFGSGTTRTGQWRCEDRNLISLTPGGGSAAVAAAGIVFNFTVTENTGVTIPANMDVGSVWSQDIKFEGKQDVGGIQLDTQNQAATSCTAVGRESVAVPAGTFDALKVECKTKLTIGMNGTPIYTLEGLTTAWYVKDVGMVKTVGSGGGYEATIELTAYQIP
jgi:hypothetical protein